MSKTIKQIADELGVSKQAVWQRIKRNEELRQALEAHSENRSGTVFVDEDGEKVIRAAYSDYLQGVNVDETTANVDETNDSVDVNVDGGTLIDALQSTINTLQEQLSTKDKQIDELTSMLKTSQEQAAALTTALTAAQALHAATVQERLEERAGEMPGATTESDGESSQREGFFKRVFGRKDR